MIALESSEVAYQERLSRLRDQIEKKTGKSAEERYAEREARIAAAVRLEQPDRVPVAITAGNFAAHYAGVPLAAAYYDLPAFKEANFKAMVDFEPDCYRRMAGASAGIALEALDAKHMRWPGGNLPPNVAYQFVEGEYMRADEYDQFLADPTDFTLRYQLPRMYGAMAPVAQLPPLRQLSGQGFTAFARWFASPELQRVAEALFKAGQAQAQWDDSMTSFEEEMAQLGFPPASHSGVGVGAAPFDAISDFYRGMRQSMMDMFRRPDKLMAACDKMLELRMSTATPATPTRTGTPKRLFMALHRGAEGFMSKTQFEHFYWPGLKKAILANIDLGYVPMPFFEGKCDARLEYLLELPKGKVICHFQFMDMARAKEIVGDHVCIMGNVPSTMLQVGSPSEVEEYCKNLITVCGRGGGFILTPGSAIDEANPANVKAMVDSVKKYSPS